MLQYGSLFERLVANTAPPETDTGCWIWTGAVGKRQCRAYPRINIRMDGKHRSLRAHRVMAEYFFGRKLTPDDEVDHLCTDSRCVNPDHLEIVTKKVNMARMWARKRSGVRT